MASSDVTLADDVKGWLVVENGVLAFPSSLRGTAWNPDAEEYLEWYLQWREWYSHYLTTEVWREKRNGALKNAHHRCERCGQEEGSLQVHHRTYKRVGGDETPEDLEVLCEACHYRHHEFADAYHRHLSGRSPA